MMHVLNVHLLPDRLSLQLKQNEAAFKWMHCHWHLNWLYCIVNYFSFNTQLAFIAMTDLEALFIFHCPAFILPQWQELPTCILASKIFWPYWIFRQSTKVLRVMPLRGSPQNSLGWCSWYKQGQGLVSMNWAIDQLHGRRYLITVELFKKPANI